MKKPMRKGKTTTVWSAPYPNKMVLRKTFRYPDGKTREFFFWGKESAGPVIIFPVTDDGKMIATKQWRPSVDGFLYELPGGHAKKGQRIKDAVAAELREEAGYEAKSLIPLAEFWLDPPAMHTVIRPFLALGCRKVTEPNLDEDEFMTHIAMPIEKWLTLIAARSGKNMKDSKSLSVTLLAIPELMKRGLLSERVLRNL